MSFSFRNMVKFHYLITVPGLSFEIIRMLWGMLVGFRILLNIDLAVFNLGLILYLD